jgi:sec-independent protein translocase protein TatA
MKALSQAERKTAMLRLGPTELLIILGIVLLLFGVGRVSRIGGELGQAIANFRKGMAEAAKPEASEEEAKEKNTASN